MTGNSYTVKMSCFVIHNYVRNIKLVQKTCNKEQITEQGSLSKEMMNSQLKSIIT